MRFDTLHNMFFFMKEINAKKLLPGLLLLPRPKRTGRFWLENTGNIRSEILLPRFADVWCFPVSFGAFSASFQSVPMKSAHFRMAESSPGQLERKKKYDRIMLPIFLNLFYSKLMKHSIYHLQEGRYQWFRHYSFCRFPARSCEDMSVATTVSVDSSSPMFTPALP